MRLVGIAAAGAAMLAAHGAAAEDLAGTLKKIGDTGALTIGHRESSIPFSYYDRSGKAVGYTMDLCFAVADAVKAKLGLPRLAVKLVPVTPSNRIPMVANGTIDLECGSTTNNLERQKVVAFSVTTFVTSNRFLAKAAANLKTVEDLRGRTIVTTVSTTNLKEISDLNAQRRLGLTIVAAKDHAEAFRMVESDRAAAFVMDDILLSSLIATSSAPADYAISADRLSVEPYGIMLRRDDAAFKQVVDDTIAGIYRRGEIYPLYGKWFLEPVPPNGISLNVPMSASLKRIIEIPIDSGDPEAYPIANRGE